MDGARVAKIGEQVFGLLAGELQPKGVRAEIQFAGPSQGPPLFTQASLAVELVIVPGSEHTSAGFGGEVHLPFHAVVEAKPDAVIVEPLESHDFLHSRWMISRDGSCSKPIVA